MSSGIILRDSAALRGVAFALINWITADLCGTAPVQETGRGRSEGEMNRQNLTLSTVFRAGGVAVLTALLFAAPASAQTVTTTDIQRLQDQVYAAGSDISRTRSTSETVSRLQDELDDLRDEVVYLKVKLRKDGLVNRREYDDVRTRVQQLRARAGGDTRTGTDTRNDTPGWTTNSAPVPSGGYGGTRGGVSGGTTRGTMPNDRPNDRRSPQGNSSIPAGQEIDVRLTQELSSGTAQVEQRFSAETVVDLYRGSDVIIPVGSVLRGVVSSVDKASRTERKGALTVSFDQITVRGRNYPIRGTVTQALESEGLKGEAAKVGAGAGVGAIIGGILGGVKGAILGVLIGGGGTIAATEGKDVTLPAGTILRVQLDTPPNIR